MHLHEVNEFLIAQTGNTRTLWVNASFEGIHEDYPVDCTANIELTPEDEQILGIKADKWDTMTDFVAEVYKQVDWERVTYD